MTGRYLLKKDRHFCYKESVHYASTPTLFYNEDYLAPNKGKPVYEKKAASFK